MKSYIDNLLELLNSIEKELIELEAAKTLGLVAWRVFFPRVLVGKEKFEREQAEYEVVPNQRWLFRLWCHLVC